MKSYIITYQCTFCDCRHWEVVTGYVLEDKAMQCAEDKMMMHRLIHELKDPFKQHKKVN